MAAGSAKKAKIYLNFGPFTGGVEDHRPRRREDRPRRAATRARQAAGGHADISPVDQKNFAKSGMLGFYIDGNVTRLDDTGRAAARRRRATSR